MKYWVLVVISLCLLAACGDEEAMKQEEESNGDSKSVTVEKEVEEPSEDSSAKEEEKEKKEDAAGEEDGSVEPQYIMNNIWTFEPIEDAKEDVVLLTFDDAPDQFGLEMAKKLKEYNAPAIFFVNGHFINTPEKEEILKKIYDMGFAIGNHTMSHPSLQDISVEEQKSEIVGLNDQIEEITGERPEFFRAPFGQNTEYTEQLAKDEGMLLMNWTYGYDWEAEYQDAESLADIMVNTELLVPGANLLMHDREWTAEAIPQIIEGFEEKGYGFIDPSRIMLDEKKER
ncbi:polysaccharide deacetylase family protein [Halobacillus sp. A1]|uniref:polysaccharide deacetylase family protein n=1 Tax=Halobacillus sp. A1 TaxID=2880262 RepID=UPI0020A61F87|nr:polysaccharide deacetylase family protein [Halobacillus sp. A1]MCP3030667.1 polysaccharide deacetylase family protein [Halobacillus sp. A1]